MKATATVLLIMLMALMAMQACAPRVIGYTLDGDCIEVKVIGEMPDLCDTMWLDDGTVITNVHLK